ncbi:MAG: hypothetical protein JKY65_06745 [Planctomycetes bacterium]|nr:hypothetical protein [Planctomycetota bacterium]
MSERLDLTAYLDDKLSPEERIVLEAELETDPKLAAELAALESVTQAIANLPRIEAPAALKSDIMDMVRPLSVARAASSMHPEKRGYVGMRARHEHRQKQKRLKQGASSKDPFVGDPFGDSPPAPPVPDVEVADLTESGARPKRPTLEELGPELTAYVDGELAPSEAERITVLARRDPQVAREIRHVRRIRSRIAALPRLEAPAHLTAQIMSEIDVLDREEAQRQVRARQARIALFQNLGRLAQAAVFLFVVGGGVFLSQPEEHPLAYRSSVSPRKARRPVAAKNPRRKKSRRVAGRRGTGRPQADETPSAQSSLASARFEVSWDLSVGGGDLEAAIVRTRGLVGRYATRLEPEFKSELDWGRVVEVPANRIDDFCAGLEASAEVSVPIEVTESLKTLHSEQDQVILKSGFVLVGRARRRGSEYVIRVGPRGKETVVHRVPVSDVARVEKAEKLRRIRVLIR